MKLIFHARAWEDYLYWQSSDPKMLARINQLIKESSRSPFQGIGKPEPLRGELRGWWSRRIDQEHRLVYRPTDDGLLIAQCRHHY
ncbi:Txe/YoeB family addiction module toxin [Peteryoungia desertarenae]|uniref:Putative mRNA interferase YoeB n=1 Tax=Peteryoungia desertarenae TaxID=1813451 RepID=A0ABX6QPX5_9HYPH|nr:Txe/YoeB family addiction module toxin [Peteryoungia desertarenae]QLF70275.1 Txe/YoeB family addiction module toxin [Peteryoungia desertarenae]